MEQAESKACNEKKRAELEIRKAKKEVKDRTESMKSIEYFWGMGYNGSSVCNSTEWCFST